MPTIRDARRAVQVAEEALWRAVADAREAGTSWAEIAAELGVSKQTAWTRYSKACGEVRWDRELVP